MLYVKKFFEKLEAFVTNFQVKGGLSANLMYKPSKGMSIEDIINEMLRIQQEVGVPVLYNVGNFILPIGKNTTFEKALDYYQKQSNNDVIMPEGLAERVIHFHSETPSFQITMSNAIKISKLNNQKVLVEFSSDFYEITPTTTMESIYALLK